MELKNILYIIVCFLFVLSGLYSCIDDPEFNSGVNNAKAPDIGEVIISGKDKTASTITLKSSVLKANGYPVTERGFVWNTDSVRPPEDDKDWWQPVGEGIGEYTDTIKNLTPGVKYFFWSYARNEVDVSYSEFDSTRTDNGLGSVKTYALKELYTINNTEYEYLPGTRATVSGKITLQGEGKTLLRGVYYSKSETFENKKTVESKTPFEQDSFVCQFSELSTLTTYYAQAFVTNEVSDVMVTTLGKTVEFETGDGKPEVDDILELKAGYNDVYVVSRILHEGDVVLEERGFCWGTNPEPVMEIDDFLPINGLHTGYIVATIEDLVPDQQYFICAYATNEFGTTYGKPKEFYVKNDKPTVQTLEPSFDYDAGTVFVNGLIYADGKSDIITKGICYSNTVQEPIVTNSTKIEISTTDNDFSENISGLKGGTKYYIRAFASNSEGISYGAVKEITTPVALMASSEAFPGSFRLSGSSAYFTIGNKGYLLGGDKGRLYIDELWSYNGSTNNWQQLKSQPEFSAKCQSVAVKGNIAYVLGGLSSGNVLVDDFRRYNSSSNLWGDPLTGGPDPAYSRMGVTLEDVSYFIGGMGDTAKNEVWSYDITPDVWVQKPDFPVEQYGGIALNIDGEIYVGMGKDVAKDGAHICNKTIWKLNMDLSTWTQETDNPLISEGILAGAVYNQKIYLIDESFYIHEYDTLSKTWTRKSRINNAGDQDVHGMFVLNGKIYIGLINNKMYKYNPLWDN